MRIYSAKVSGPSRWMRSRIKACNGDDETCDITHPSKEYSSAAPLIAEIHDQEIQSHLRRETAAFQRGICLHELVIGMFELRGAKLADVAQGLFNDKRRRTKGRGDLRGPQTVSGQLFDQQQAAYLRCDGW